MSKLSKLLNDLIEKNGIIEASNMVSLSVPELIQKSDYPINSEIAGILLGELVSTHKEMRYYKNIELDYDDLDGVCRITYSGDWNGNYERAHIAATPFWDGKPVIPIDTDYYLLTTDIHEVIIEDDIEEFTEIKTRGDFDSIEDLLTWYKHFYLPKVYNVIVNDHLPKIREQLKSEIDKFEQSNDEELTEKWSLKYKRSIDCKHPKGFSQRAHCQGRKK